MLLHRPIQTAAVALVSLAVTALTATVGAAAAVAAPRSATPVFSALPFSQLLQGLRAWQRAPAR